MKKVFIFLLLVSTSTLHANEWSGDISLQSRHFSNNALLPSQFKEYGSVAIKAEWFHGWDDGKQNIRILVQNRKESAS